jgi:hypothetical protein
MTSTAGSGRPACAYASPRSHDRAWGGPVGPSRAPARTDGVVIIPSG